MSEFNCHILKDGRPYQKISTTGTTTWLQVMEVVLQRLVEIAEEFEDAKLVVQLHCPYELLRPEKFAAYRKPKMLRKTEEESDDGLDQET